MDKPGKARAVGFVVYALFVAGPPVALVCLQWGVAAHALLVPETTCWIAATDDHFLYAVEGPAVLALLGMGAWAPAAAAVTAVALLVASSRRGRLRVAAVAVIAVLFCVALYEGTSLAVEAEQFAHRSIRGQC